MIYYLSEEQLEKLKLLDRLFAAMSVTQLSELVEKEEVVAKLSGKDATVNLFQNLYINAQYMEGELANLRTQNRQVAEDFDSLLRILNNSVFSPNQYGNISGDFYNLQSRVGSRHRY